MGSGIKYEGRKQNAISRSPPIKHREVRRIKPVDRMRPIEAKIDILLEETDQPVQSSSLNVPID
jgi:hypothetical protein